MFALKYDRFGGPEVLSIGPMPEPHAVHGEVRIRVRAAGVAPADALLRSGHLRPEPPSGWPHIPGVDAAGVVDEIGPDPAREVAIGDEVFGAVDVMRRLGGASAEFAVLQHWATRPAQMSWEQAGGAATSIETATRALNALEVRAESTLLVDGGAGAVGSTTVQLARARGATVIATASSPHHRVLAELGAEPTEYGHGLTRRVAALAPHGVDAALDAAGCGSLPDLIEITGDPTRIVTIADTTAARHGVRFSHSGPAGGTPGWPGLDHAAQLAESGHLHILVRDAIPLEDGARAHHQVATGHGRGKLVLVVT